MPNASAAAMEQANNNLTMMFQDEEELVTMPVHDSSSSDDDDEVEDSDGGDRSSMDSTSLDSKGADSRTSGDLDSMENIEAQLTEKKTVAVNRLRGCVMLMLVLSALGVSVTVFILSRNADIEAFEIQYEGNVDKILDAFNGVFEDMGAISGLANDATTQSSDNNVSWPFLTLSNYHGRGGNARKLSGALFISLSHIVTKEQRPQWEDYVLSDANVWMCVQ
jgi:hypothetical protein